MNNILVENLKGHGALPRKGKWRDKKYSRLAQSPAPFDWSVGYTVPFMPLVEDQGESDSCGGQALRYYLESLYNAKTQQNKRLSAKYTYSQIFYPGGGTDIRSIGKIATTQGSCSETLVPSYENGQAPSEPFMEETNLNAGGKSDAIAAEEFGMAFPDCDINSIAEAIRDNNGCILQVTGQNNGTWLSPYPQPPVNTTNSWSHFLWACGAETINGVQYIKVLNSWGNTVGTNGYQWLPASYFNGWVTDAMVLYPNSIGYTPTFWQKLILWLENFNPNLLNSY